MIQTTKVQNIIHLSEKALTTTLSHLNTPLDALPSTLDSTPELDALRLAISALPVDERFDLMALELVGLGSFGDLPAARANALEHWPGGQIADSLSIRPSLAQHLEFALEQCQLPPMGQ